MNLSEIEENFVIVSWCRTGHCALLKASDAATEEWHCSIFLDGNISCLDQLGVWNMIGILKPPRVPNKGIEVVDAYKSAFRV